MIKYFLYHRYKNQQKKKHAPCEIFYLHEAHFDQFTYFGAMVKFFIYLIFNVGYKSIFVVIFLFAIYMTMVSTTAIGMLRLCPQGPGSAQKSLTSGLLLKMLTLLSLP